MATKVPTPLESKEEVALFNRLHQGLWLTTADFLNVMQDASRMPCASALFRLHQACDSDTLTGGPSVQLAVAGLAFEFCRLLPSSISSEVKLRSFGSDFIGVALAVLSLWCFVLCFLFSRLKFCLSEPIGVSPIPVRTALGSRTHVTLS